MNIKISLDNLDEAISQLEELAQKIHEYPHHVAQDIANQIDYKVVVVESTEGSNRILISNSDNQIAFQEFGAGYGATKFVSVGDDTHFVTYPGVYSEDHKKTFFNKKYNASNYPYNVPAQKKAINAINKASATALERAGKDFGN